MHALSRALACAILIAIFSASSSPAALAQGGYRSTTFEELGFEIPVPRYYKAVPVEPTEEWVVLKWVDEKTNAKKREDYTSTHRRFLPELMVIWVDHIAVAATTPSGGDTPSDEDGDDDSGSGGDPIRSFETYMEQVWTRGDKPLYSVGQPAELDEIDDNDVYYYELQARQGMPPAQAVVFRNARRSLIFFGRSSSEDWKTQSKIWSKITDDIEIFPPQAVDLTKWERFYEKKTEFVDPDYRLKVRASLVKGWEADDTENYIFVYSTKDEALLRLLKREMEAIRKEYERLFPAVEPVTAVSTVRICRDQAEYAQYGGPSGSGGYWYSAAEELVFYDYSADEEKRGEGKKDSRIVLYHEAFHQYIYYSAGEVAPHSWYNEGTGDFFSGAKISGKKVTKIGQNPWRNNYIKSIVEGGEWIPFADILAFTQREFYQPQRRGKCYAQAWSMIYFLRTSKVVAKHEQWSQILHVYFEELKRAYNEEVAVMLEEMVEGLEDEDGEEAASVELSSAMKSIAAEASREIALEVAFDGIDLNALEREWEQFVLDLKELR